MGHIGRGGDGVDTPEFENIYAEYFSDVYKYVLSLCRNETTAEEITQETFFKAMRYIDKFNGSCKLYVWLCQIAKNTYFKAIAKRKHIAPEINEDTPDPAMDVEKTYLDSEDAKKLHILLHNLNEPYKEVLCSEYLVSYHSHKLENCLEKRTVGQG